MRWREFLSDDEGEGRRRWLSLALTLVAHLLLLLMLLTLVPRQFVPMSHGGSLTTFSVAPESEKDKDASKPAAKQAAARPITPTVRTPTPQPTPPPIVKMPTPLKMPDGFIELSRTDMKQVDTAMNTQHAAGPAVADAGAGGGSQGDTPSTPGPRGEPLYAAEWYREPTRAELEPYMPKHMTPPVSGMIACQTVARFHVDNCYELGDSLPGAGIARAMRQAAFQFLVRPPRVGGRTMVGTWVRIEYTILPARAGGDDGP